MSCFDFDQYLTWCQDLSYFGIMQSILHGQSPSQFLSTFWHFKSWSLMYVLPSIPQTGLKILQRKVIHRFLNIFSTLERHRFSSCRDISPCRLSPPWRTSWHSCCYMFHHPFHKRVSVVLNNDTCNQNLMHLKMLLLKENKKIKTWHSCQTIHY